MATIKSTMPDAKRTADSLHRDCCASLPEPAWRPEMKTLIEWRDGLKLQEDDPEKDALERLLFQMDGRVRYLEARHNDPDQRPGESPKNL